MGDRNLKDNPFFLRRPNYSWSSDEDESAYIELPRVYMGLSAEDIPSISGDGPPQPEQAEVNRREVQSTSGRRVPPTSVGRDLPVLGRRETAAAAARTEQNDSRRTQMQQDRDLFWRILTNTTPRSNILARSQPVVGVSPTRSSSSILEWPDERASGRASERRSSANELLVHEHRYKKHRRESNSIFSCYRVPQDSSSCFSAHSSPPYGSGLVYSTSSTRAEPVAGSSQPIRRLLEPSAGHSEPIAGPSSEPVAGPSRPRVADQESEINAEEPPVAELTIDALEKEYTRWLNIGESGINPRERTRESENAEAARLTLDEVVVEAPEDISPPDPAAPDADGDQPDGGDRAVAIPSVQPTDAAQSHRPTNLAIESQESPQPGTSNGVGGKRKRDSPDDNRRPDTVAEFNMLILRHLECPVCLDWMEPPIAQCRRGHVVCPRCRARLNACPVCRTPFSSVRNRAMEGVAELLQYPCRHGCGRAAGVQRRARHEASCARRRYHCPAPACRTRRAALPRELLAAHFQGKHSSIIRTGVRHKFFLSVRSELHKSFIIMALDQFFHLNIDIDVHTWGAVMHVSYIGPKKLCKYYVYEITMKGTGALRKLVYARNTHSDLEKLSLSVPGQDRFHLTAEQARNYICTDKNNTEKYLAFALQINQLKDYDEVDEISD